MSPHTLFTPTRRASLYAGLVLAALTGVACGGDRATSPLHASDAPSFARRVPRPSITSVVLHATSVALGGGVAYDVTIQNPASSDATGISIDAEFDQGNVSRAAGGSAVGCGGAAGVLPPGSCTMTLTATADNAAAGTGLLAAGNAKLLVMLNQSDGVTTTLLDSKTLKVTLIGDTHTAPYISALSPDFTSLAIDGAAGNYTITVANPTGVNQSTVFVQAVINQGSATKGASGTDVLCFPGNLNPGLLPPGNCTFTYSTAAANQNGGTGTLVAGPAVWRLELYIYDGVTSTLLDFREVNITLTGP